jgi:hypothetical protein
MSWILYIVRLGHDLVKPSDNPVVASITVDCNIDPPV